MYSTIITTPFTWLEMKAESPSTPASLLHCAGNRGMGWLVPLASGLQEYVVAIFKVDVRGEMEEGFGCMQHGINQWNKVLLTP